MNKSEYKLVMLYLDGALTIASLFTLQTFFKFTKLHLLYWPETIDIFSNEYSILIVTLFIFASSILFNMKATRVTSLLSIVVALFNIIAFKLASAILLGVEVI